MRRFAARALAICLLLFLAVSCRAVLRYPASTEPPRVTAAGDPEWVDSINPHVVTNLLTRRLVVEVDWIEGYPPSDRAIDGLKETLQRHLPAGKSWEVVLDDEIPRARFEESESGNRGFFDIAAEFLDRFPERENGTDVVYILGAPDAKRWFGGACFGIATTVPLEETGRKEIVRTIVLGGDAIRRQAVLWIGAPKVERATLIHEFGHVLGLVQNPEHAQRGNPGHCTEPQCIMTHPTLRSILYSLPRGFFLGRLPDDYCGKCRGDLVQARTIRESRAAEDDRSVKTLALAERARDLCVGGFELEDAGRLEDALAWLAESRAVADLPDLSHSIAFSIASTLHRLRRLEEALEAYQQAEAIRPEEPPLSRAAVLCDLGRYEEARALFDPVVKGPNPDFFAYRTLARSLNGLGRHAEEAEVWADFLGRPSARPEQRIDPRVVAWYRLEAMEEMARARARAGDLAGAEEAYRTTAREGDTWHRLPLAEFLIAQGRPDEGKRLAEEVRRAAARQAQGKDSTGALLLLARAEAVLGQRENALRSLERAGGAGWDAGYVAHHAPRSSPSSGTPQAPWASCTRRA